MEAREIVSIPARDFVLQPIPKRSLDVHKSAGPESGDTGCPYPAPRGGRWSELRFLRVRQSDARNVLLIGAAAPLPGFRVRGSSIPVEAADPLRSSLPVVARPRLRLDPGLRLVRSSCAS